MLIKIGRLRLAMTILPRVPQMEDTPECKRLGRRLALYSKHHKKTRPLERKRALAKFGISA